MDNRYIKYFDNFLIDDTKEILLNWLNNIEFKIGINNDNSIIKRKQLWYQKNQKPFNELWKKYDRWCSEPIYNNHLINLENIIKLLFVKNNINIDININSCLINKYENGKDFIKYHQDSSKAFGKNHYIIIFSLGENRLIRFRNINNKNNTFDINLKSNSLILIYPNININYEHSIIKDESENPRFSLTFREFIS
jgi:alkylated DNA repair dioxygenase AlkB